MSPRRFLTSQAAACGTMLLASALGGCSAAAPTAMDAAIEDASVDAPAEDIGVVPPIDAGLDAGEPDAGPLTCATAAALGSHYGCEHWVVDLDTRSVFPDEPFGITVTNPGPDEAEVTVERSTAGFGGPTAVEMVASATILPGASSSLSLGSFEVDDGTHTALTANGLRVRSTRPVAVIQENPLGSAAIVSAGASLVFPTHALGVRHTVVGWPQTIANSADPREDFDPGRTDEDLRAFLTVLGTAPATSVTVTLGPVVGRVVGAGSIAESGAGEVVTVTLGPFDVLNLETGAFGADFTGSVVTSSAPVAVFVGSESSDVPHFSDIASRACCADHLEVQLPPDARAGRRFVIARASARAHAINVASVTATLPETEDPQWIRVVSLDPSPTTLTTTLRSPRNRLTIAPGSFVEVSIDADAVIESDHPVVVVQALPSAEAAGIAAYYPGGDPALYWVPPVENYASDYAFAVPEGFAFDALTIVAPTGVTVTLGGASLPGTCVLSALGTDWAVYRCPLSVPGFTGAPDYRVLLGAQQDGFHRLSATAPFTAYWSGFQAYIGSALSVGATFGP